MKVSRRARRMERHHKQRKQPALNLISLMDIFTILVFFLLVNSSTSQQMPSQQEMKLPNSIAKKAPKETLIIAITKNQVLVGGRSVGSVQEIMANGKDTIPQLKEELEFEASKTLITEDAIKAAQKGRTVTIMGDRDTSYELVSKILTTCQQANFTNISFAANQKAKSQNKS